MLKLFENNHYSPCTITQVIDLNNVLFLTQLREVMSHTATTPHTNYIYLTQLREVMSYPATTPRTYSIYTYHL